MRHERNRLTVEIFEKKLVSAWGGSYPAGNHPLLMAVTGSFSGQCWHLNAEHDGYFRLANDYLGNSRSLDTYSDGDRAPFMAETSTASGQYRKLTRLQSNESGGCCNLIRFVCSDDAVPGSSIAEILAARPLGEPLESGFERDFAIGANHFDRHLNGGPPAALKSIPESVRFAGRNAGFGG